MQNDAASTSADAPPPHGHLTTDERAKHAGLLAALGEALDSAWISRQASLTILFCSKLDVQKAVKKYVKWVKMLTSFGFASLAEVYGPTAAAHMEGQANDSGGTSGSWADLVDWAELRADTASHGFILPAGKDAHGRQVMWERGVMTCAPGGEKAVIRVLALIWLAVHADLTTLREGVVVVHMVKPDDGSKLTHSTTRALIGAALAFPLRPQKVLVAGLGPGGLVIAKTFIRFLFAVTRTKLLDRILFVPYPELWSHVPHRSIPKLHGVLRSGGAYSGIEQPIDWIEQRLRNFVCSQQDQVQEGNPSDSSFWL